MRGMGQVDAAYEGNRISPPKCGHALPGFEAALRSLAQTGDSWVQRRLIEYLQRMEVGYEPKLDIRKSLLKSILQSAQTA